MRIIVSDSSCLIDLWKASLLDSFLKLPYEVLIPNSLFEDEFIKFTDSQKRALVLTGLKAVDLPGKSVLRARQVIRDAPRLSTHDGFAFALAEMHPGCILLAGEGALRILATAHRIDVRGVLWVVDEIHSNELSTAAALHAALLLLAKDGTAILPGEELPSAVKRYDGLR
jgi:predicted nucleic acid-binding protein